jgi:hypothetical protein
MKYIAAIIVLAACTAARAAMDAKEIVQAQRDRHRIVHETTRLRIILTDRRGNTEERTMRRIDKEDDRGLRKSLSFFLEPADVRGTALLTRENEDKPNDQWLYLPSQRRLQRIARGRRSGYFMGTDFTYEDMDPERIDSFTYRLLEPENLEGVECNVIEAVPANETMRRNSGYSKRILWISKDTLVSLKIDFFDHRGNHIKTQTNHDIQTVTAEARRPKRSLMIHHAKKHQTEIRVESRDVETKLDEVLFTERNILTGRYLR